MPKLKDLSNLTEEDIQKISNDLLKVIKTLDTVYDETRAKMSYDDLKSFMSQLTDDKSISTDTLDDVSQMYQIVIEDMIEEFITKYFNISSMEELNYTAFTDPSIQRGYEIMFTNWFIPVLHNGHKAIIERASGQGESMITIFYLDLWPESKHDRYVNYTYVTKWYDFDEIFNYNHLE